MSSIDYFEKYFTAEGLDFPKLVNDDFMEPIRLLWKHQYYVSATKLLMSFVDSIGYIEYGETVSNPFVEWLTTYAELSPVAVTAEELWEHRNSLLHMSNLDSRKVVAGKVKRVAAYVGSLPEGATLMADELKYFSLQQLILEVANGCGRWFESYNTNRAKIHDFVARYDLIASDARMVRVPIGEARNRQ